MLVDGYCREDYRIFHAADVDPDLNVANLIGSGKGSDWRRRS